MKTISTPPVVAVTGLGRGESPQPGAAVIASLRRRWPDIKIAGLVYDAMESGAYCDGSPDAIFTLPYPSCGGAAIRSRLEEIGKEFPFTVLIPTLDAEMEPLIGMRDSLLRAGIRIMAPDAEAMKARSKQNLAALADRAGVSVPRTLIACDPVEAAEHAATLGGAVMVKGPYYEANRADTPAVACAHANRILAEWGGPVLVQELLEGEEFDLLIVGDGDGGTLGSCAVRKLVVSSRGKGYAGITVSDHNLSNAGAALMRELKWSGPCECEFIRDRNGEFHLIEINPRFPAWADFPSAIGCNLAAAALQNLLGIEVEKPSAVEPGKIFLRHSVDIVCDSDDFVSLAAEGRILRTPQLQTLP